MNLFILRKKSYWSLEGSIIQTKIEMTRSSIITAVPPLYKNRYLDLRVVNGRIVDAATTRRSCNDGSRLDIIEIVTSRKINRRRSGQIAGETWNSTQIRLQIKFRLSILTAVAMKKVSPPRVDRWRRDPSFFQGWDSVLTEIPISTRNGG